MSMSPGMCVTQLYGAPDTGLNGWYEVPGHSVHWQIGLESQQYHVHNTQKINGYS